MRSQASYESPIGQIILSAEDGFLTGLDLPGFQPDPIAGGHMSNPILVLATAWLDAYFSGQKPSPADLPLNPQGTLFQREVWDLLCAIPYGQHVTYGQLAQAVAQKKATKRMSARAIGQAAGKNPLPIIIPCHRLLAANGKLGGYSGGIAIKIKLLEHERLP